MDRGMAAVLKAWCILLISVGYGSSASEAVGGSCPLVAPLSSYSPSISSGGLRPVTPQVAAQLGDIVTSFMDTNRIQLYAVSVVHTDQMVYTSGLASSPFMIGSITKCFTALGALLLRERGLLSLDDPVTKFLPSFKVVNPYERHDITLRELRGHLSGLPRELCGVYDPAADDQSHTLCPVEEAHALKSIARMQLVRPPWSREPAYSNLAFAVLGHAWEKATSPPKAWDEFVVEDILRPLGMNGTGMDLTNVTLVTGIPLPPFGWVAPAGTMYSTATDLAKYLIFLLNAKPALISGASIREWTNSRTIFPDGSGGYALPWELSTINATGREFVITKGGAVDNYMSIIAIHPPTQLGFSFLFYFNDSVYGRGVGGLMADVLNYLIPLVEQETAGIIDPLYTGHYVCNATDPIFSRSLNVTAQVLGGFIAVADSPSLGLSAAVNVSLLLDGRPLPQVGRAGMLLKNSTENSFWLGGVSCADYFAGISANPSLFDPNYPTAEYVAEIEFDFAQKKLSWPAVGAVCFKNSYTPEITSATEHVRRNAGP